MSELDAAGVEAAIEAARELLLMLHLEVMTGATLTTPAVTAMMTELDTAIFAWDVAVAAPAERGDETGGAETTLAFPVRAEDYVTGPEMPGVVGDGQAFFLSEDTYLAADAAAAPAVGVTVDRDEIDQLFETFAEARIEVVMTDLPGGPLAFMEQAEATKHQIIALLTASSEGGRGGEAGNHVVISARKDWKP